MIKERLTFEEFEKSFGNKVYLENLKLLYENNLGIFTKTDLDKVEYFLQDGENIIHKLDYQWNPNLYQENYQGLTIFNFNKQIDRNEHDSNYFFNIDKFNQEISEYFSNKQEA